MSFKRYQVHVTPRRLTSAKRIFLGVDSVCMKVVDPFIGARIPPEGAVIHVTTEEHERTLLRLERDGDIMIRLPAQHDSHGGEQ